jgi:hypothetical protein
MCLGRHTEDGVAQVVHANSEVSLAPRLPFDRYYNFFARSARKVNDLARHPAVTAVARLKVLGALYLVLDDTLLHKRGPRVFGRATHGLDSATGIAHLPQTPASRGGHNASIGRGSYPRGLPVFRISRDDDVEEPVVNVDTAAQIVPAIRSHPPGRWRIDELPANRFDPARHPAAGVSGSNGPMGRLRSSPIRGHERHQDRVAAIAAIRTEDCPHGRARLWEA